MEQEYDMTFTTDWLNTKDITPHWERLLSDLKEKPVNMLEIGCFEGRSTLWFLENVLTDHESKITCLDTFEGDLQQEKMKVDTKNLLERFIENIDGNKKVKTIRGNSQNVLKTLAEEYDLIYIDGSHYQTDVLHDMVLCFDLLKSGGVMICDDYGMTFVKDGVNNKPRIAIDAFISVYEPHIIELHKGWQYIMRKK